MVKDIKEKKLLVTGLTTGEKKEVVGHKTNNGEEKELTA
jgi:hypothetical protein